MVRRRDRDPPGPRRWPAHGPVVGRGTRRAAGSQHGVVGIHIGWAREGPAGVEEAPVATLQLRVGNRGDHQSRLGLARSSAHVVRPVLKCKPLRPQAFEHPAARHCRPARTAGGPVRDDARIPRSGISRDAETSRRSAERRPGAAQATHPRCEVRRPIRVGAGFRRRHVSRSPGATGGSRSRRRGGSWHHQMLDLEKRQDRITS